MDFSSIAGLLARGRDFGQGSSCTRRQLGREPFSSEGCSLENSGGRATKEDGNLGSAEAEDVLADVQRKTQLRGVVAALSAEEAADWLGIDAVRLQTLVAKGQVVAFVFNGELRYPAWQFTDEDAFPVLPGLASLVAAWGEEAHPSVVLSFMYNANIRIEDIGASLTPIAWLALGGDIRPVLDALEESRWR